jgi:DNA-binding response OmpR family regulator
MNTLPDVPGDQAAVLASSLQTNPASRILVVEDDKDVREFNTKALSRSGYEVDTAEDGAAAWQALNTDSYDLMITDHIMPKLTGVELLKKLRAARMALPVIMATGTLPEEELTRYPWLRPAATLLKPYTVTDLLGTVKEILRATDGARAPVAPPPNRQSQPPAIGLQL